MPRYTSKKELSQEYLQKRLRKTILLIVLFIVGSITTLTFFGPQIGGLFGFISVHKDDQGPQARVNLAPPILNNLPKAVKAEEITIEGYAIPGTTVVIYLNGPKHSENLVDAEGKFRVENLKLIEGNNTIFGRVIDNENNESEKSETVRIVYDKKSPKLEITTPSDGDVIKNLNKRVRIMGTVNEKATITINERFVVQKADNSFDYYLGVSEGNVEIEVVATDEAGNESKEELVIQYVEDAE